MSVRVRKSFSPKYKVFVLRLSSHTYTLWDIYFQKIPKYELLFRNRKRKQMKDQVNEFGVMKSAGWTQKTESYSLLMWEKLIHHF